MRTAFLCLVIAILFCISGCTPLLDRYSRDNLCDDNTAPQTYENEEDFIAAVKKGEISPDYSTGKITHYFRPKNLPEGANLVEIRVSKISIIMTYWIDGDHSTYELGRGFIYSWFTDIVDPVAYFHQPAEKGTKIGEMAASPGNMTISFVIGDDPMTKEQKKENTESGTDSSQVSAYFTASIPFQDCKTDFAKYLEMELVEIER